MRDVTAGLCVCWLQMLHIKKLTLLPERNSVTEKGAGQTWWLRGGIPLAELGMLLWAVAACLVGLGWFLSVYFSMRKTVKPCNSLRAD